MRKKGNSAARRGPNGRDGGNQVKGNVQACHSPRRRRPFHGAEPPWTDTSQSGAAVLTVSHCGAAEWGWGLPFIASACVEWGCESSGVYLGEAERDREWLEGNLCPGEDIRCGRKHGYDNRKKTNGSVFSFPMSGALVPRISIRPLSFARRAKRLQYKPAQARAGCLSESCGATQQHASKAHIAGDATARDEKSKAFLL